MACALLVVFNFFCIVLWWKFIESCERPRIIAISSEVFPSAPQSNISFSLGDRVTAREAPLFSSASFLAIPSVIIFIIVRAFFNSMRSISMCALAKTKCSVMPSVFRVD